MLSKLEWHIVKAAIDYGRDIEKSRNEAAGQTLYSRSDDAIQNPDFEEDRGRSRAYLSDCLTAMLVKSLGYRRSHLIDGADPIKLSEHLDHFLRRVEKRYLSDPGATVQIGWEEIWLEPRDD